MNYGLPYQGSKNRIVKKLATFFPRAEHFFDLFAGGCAMTHFMMLDGRYEYLHANDINDIPKLFLDAVNGKYRDEKRWISRKEFLRLRDTDPYVKMCWSFGNNQRSYIYGGHIEPYKKALHYAVIFGDFTLLHKLCPEVANSCEDALLGMKDTKQRRIEIGRAVVKWLKAYGTPEMVESNPLYKSCHRKKDKQSLESLERLQSLQSLESLERLQRLQRLQRLEITQEDYRKVEIAPDSVVYCDIPYKNTKGYNTSFDHEAFYNWARQQKELTIISEYAMPEDFVCIAEIGHKSTLCATSVKKTKEKLFIPAHQKELYETMLFNSFQCLQSWKE